MADPNIVYLTKEDEGKCGITKKILNAGKGDLPSFEDGTRVLNFMSSAPSLLDSSDRRGHINFRVLADSDRC